MNLSRLPLTPDGGAPAGAEEELSAGQVFDGQPKVSARWPTDRVYEQSPGARPALDALDKAYEDRSSWFTWISVDPRFDVVRDDRATAT
jgi:hypothetical protein